MIEVRDLIKTYRDRKRGKIEALRGISFDCPPGQIFGLLGPNGAGKTTALRIISTALRPTAGTGRVLDFDLTRQSRQVRESIGFLSCNTGLYVRLTAREVLTYFGRLFRMSNSDIAGRIQELADLFEMGDFLDRACGKLSTGMQQKVNIARTVIHSPPVMIFDEPTAGLDVLTSRTIINFIRACKEEGRTVLLSTHIMAEVEKLCDRVAILHEGKIYFDGTVEDFRGSHSHDLDEAFINIIEGGA